MAITFTRYTFCVETGSSWICYPRYQRAGRKIKINAHRNCQHFVKLLLCTGNWAVLSIFIHHFIYSLFEKQALLIYKFLQKGEMTCSKSCSYGMAEHGFQLRQYGVKFALYQYDANQSLFWRKILSRKSEVHR